jgi:hypothetical protein
MNVSLKDRLRSICCNDFFAALVFLIAYLCTNSYIYGFDDQHLEIPLLKHLIDPSLYRGDYYVESLARNFSSYMYPLLAKCIKVSQVPAAYLTLFLIARYFIFLSLYKLWKLISKDKFSAVCAIFMFMVLGRTEEFLYRTFSHQIAGECFMFAGIYLFFKERYFLAALIFGLAANIHGIYNLFPMIFMLVFLLLFHPKRWEMVLKTGSIFTLACMPFLVWQVPRSIHEKISGTPVPLSEWLPLYNLSCPQNCLFNGLTWDKAMKDIPFVINQVEPYVFLVVLYVILLFVYPPFRKDQKTHVVVWTASALIIFSTIFSYAIPSRFVIDLNLIRNEQFIRLFLMAYTTFWAVKVVKEGKPWQAFLAAVMFVLIGFGNWEPKIFMYKFQKDIYIFAAMAVVFIALNFKLPPRVQSILRKSLIVIPLAASFVSYCMFHYNYLQVKHHGGGFWQLQRNWVDMQLYVRDHTPKDAMVLAPIDMQMGGFRIHSERKVPVCIRDCGIVGFDYQAAVEWRRRMEDLKGFVVMTNQPIDKAVMTAIFKYKVDYIVFMNYYAPKDDNAVLKKMYQNEVFCLFKVMVRV